MSKLLHKWISLFSVSVLWGSHDTPSMLWMCKCGLVWGGGHNTPKERDQNCLLTSAPQSIALVCPTCFRPLSFRMDSSLWLYEGHLGVTVWGVSPNSAFCGSCSKPVIFLQRLHIYLLHWTRFQVTLWGGAYCHQQCFACGMACWEVVICLTWERGKCGP